MDEKNKVQPEPQEDEAAPHGGTFAQLQHTESEIFDPKKNLLLLFFKDKTVENEFVQYYYGKKLIRFRGAGIFLCIIYAVYALWDYLQPSLFEFHIISRLAVTLPMAAVFVVLLFINPLVRIHHVIPEILVFCFLIIFVAWSGVKSVVSNVSDISYPVGFPLTIFVAYLTVRTRIYVSLIIGVLCTLTYILSFVICIWAIGMFPFHYRFPVYCVEILYMNVISFVSIYIVENYFRKRFVAEKQLELHQIRMKQENKRNEGLLLNILPKHMVPKLKAVHTGIVMDSHPDVSVLFSDICNFTKYSSTTPAEEVVFMLNNHFSYFDSLSSRLGLEKVKTIGDAYFCIGGLRDLKGENRTQNSVKIMEMATGMMRHIAKMNKKFGWSFQIRVGCASGSATAAIIGDKKYTFDCYGKTILHANEMESASIPGCVHVTKTLMERGEDVFDFYGRGDTDVGGFGKQETYIILGKKNNARITDIKHIHEGGTNAFKLTDHVYQEQPTAGGNDSDHEQNENNEQYENETIYSKVELPEIEQPVSETPVEATHTDAKPGAPANINAGALDLRLVPVLFFFRKWATEKKFFWESYKETRFILVMVLFIMWSMDVFYVLNQVVVVTPLAGTSPFIVSYILVAVQLVICIIMATPLGRNAIVGLLSALTSMAISYVMSIIIILSESLALEYTGLYSLCCVFMLSLPPNVPYFLKAVLNLAVFLIPVLDFMLYDHSWAITLLFVLGTNLIMTFTYAFVDYAAKQSFILNEKSRQEIEKVEKEQQANEALILSALPKPIAERLKTTPESTFDTIGSGSVCFVKVYGFDDALIEAEETQENVEFEGEMVKKSQVVLLVLDRIFAGFDALTAENDCEKIKSIGATYMAVCGCPNYVPDHAIRIARLSLSFQQAAAEVLEEFNWLNLHLTVKIGIHAGGFVAGVLGSTKFLYDVFGDTVNTAARMCTTNETGRIQCCGAMVESIKDKCILEERGVLEVKGKGKLQIWYLNGCNF